jgi:hypothetical protein
VRHVAVSGHDDYIALDLRAHSLLREKAKAAIPYLTQRPCGLSCFWKANEQVHLTEAFWTSRLRLGSFVSEPSHPDFKTPHADGNRRAANMRSEGRQPATLNPST